VSIITYLFFTAMKMRSLKNLGLQPWPLKATWCHWLHDHWTQRGHFPVGGQ